jgi:glycogen(starch) synthase
MFGWEFPPSNSGGLGTACAGLTRALAENGTSVTFVLPRKVPISAARGVRFLFANVPDAGYFPAYPSVSLKGVFEKRFYSGNLREQVKLYALYARDIAAREEFDIIHAHDWLSFGAGIEAKRVSGKPLVVHVHATQFDHTGGKGVDSELYELERQGLEMADAIIAVSQFTKNKIIEHYGIEPSKIVVVHNGVEEYESEAPDQGNLLYDLRELKKGGKKIVLFLGRITLMKGPDYFLRAARKVAEIYPGVVFVIAGTGDMERQIIREAAEYGLGGKVIFAGFVRGEALKNLYSAADLYVMPSVSEPFGIAPLEALSSGTPVLISKQSGVSEVLTHALKADFWNVDDIADKIISVLRHPALYKTLKKNGETEVRGITWGKAAKKISEIYRNIIKSVKSIPRV